jgi:hypothetical protein
MPLDGNLWFCPMNPHSAMHSSCMKQWHHSLQITRKGPSCPLCQQIVPWICDFPEAVVGTDVAAADGAVSDDDLLEVGMLLLDADMLLATTSDLDAMLNDVMRILPCATANFSW